MAGATRSNVNAASNAPPPKAIIGATLRSSGFQISVERAPSGSDMALTTPKKNRRLAELLGCEYRELPGTGHMIQAEQPEELAGILTEFLEGKD